MKASENLGLSKLESDIYNAVLDSGRLTLMGIAKKTKSNRTTLYPYVDELLRKNYLMKTVVGKRTYYVAANPNKIFKTLKKQLGDFEERLPFLLDVYSRGKKQPTIHVHEGKEAVFEAFRTAYQEAFYIKTFFEFEKFEATYDMKKEGAELFRLLRERGIRAQGLASNSAASRKFAEKYKDELFEARFMPPEITFPSEFFVYNQKVLIVSYERKFAVVIESEDIRLFLETLFDYFWKISSKG